VTTPDSGGPPRPVCACRRIAAPPVSQDVVGAKPAAQIAGSRPARRARGAASWALPSVALALIPKCPMCIAAYLALGGGLGISFSTAAHLRIALLWLCWTALAVLVARLVLRFRSGKYSIAAARQVLSRARRDTRSAARTAAA
jgi:hypothetical protein